MHRLAPVVTATLAVSLAAPLRGQGVPIPRAGATVGGDSGCTYLRCGLSIAPAWNGLAVVRGAGGERVANLGFFWPRMPSAAFAGGDSATWYAARAVRVRRIAAVLTDGGAGLLVYAAARQLQAGRLRRAEQGVAIVGAVALAASVPLQFSADGLLSRAVWWYNARLAP